MILGLDEHDPPLREVQQGVGLDRPGLRGDHHPVGSPVVDGPQWRVTLEAVIHDRLSRRRSQHAAAQADQAPGRDIALHVHPIAALVERKDLAAPRAEQFQHRADAFLIDIDRQQFDRLAGEPVDHLFDDLGPADRKFVSFPPHVLQQDSQMKQPAPGNPKLLRRIAGLHPQGQVRPEFPLETFGKLTGGDELTFFSREGRVVDAKQHVEGGLIHRDPGDGVRLIRAGDGVADLEIAETLDRAKIANRNDVRRNPSEILEAIQFLDPGPSLRAVGLANRDGLAGSDRPRKDAPDRNATHVV